MSAYERGSADNAQALAAKAVRWRIDHAGRTIYHPFGPARHGYVVDAQHVRTLREADQRYSDRSNRLRPFGVLLGLALTYPAKLLYGTQPFFALAYLVLIVVLLVLTEWTCRYFSVKSALQGLPIAPAETGPRQKQYGLIALVSISFAAGWYVPLLYEKRLAVLPSSTGTTSFYPSVSGLLLLVVITSWIVFAVLARHGQHAPNKRVALTALTAIIFQVLAVTILILRFYDPKPRIVITDSSLWCGKRLSWSNVTSLNMQTGSRGKEYVQLEFKIPANDAVGMTHENCEIDGLNADYNEVYRSIGATWRNARQTR